MAIGDRHGNCIGRIQIPKIFQKIFGGNCKNGKVGLDGRQRLTQKSKNAPLSPPSIIVPLNGIAGRKLNRKKGERTRIGRTG